MSIKTISKKLFLRKKYLFITLGCRAKRFLSKISRGLEKSRISVSIWKIWWKTWFLKKKFPQPLTCRATLSAVCRNSSTLYCTWKLHYTRPYKTFLKQFFLKNSILFFRNLGLWSIFPGFLADFFREGCQYCNLYI